jgi:hypothetical protein
MAPTRPGTTGLRRPADVLAAGVLPAGAFPVGTLPAGVVAGGRWITWVSSFDGAAVWGAGVGPDSSAGRSRAGAAGGVRRCRTSPGACRTFGGGGGVSRWVMSASATGGAGGSTAVRGSVAGGAVGRWVAELSPAGDVSRRVVSPAGDGVPCGGRGSRCVVSLDVDTARGGGPGAPRLPSVVLRADVVSVPAVGSAVFGVGSPSCLPGGVVLGAGEVTGVAGTPDVV